MRRRIGLAPPLVIAAALLAAPAGALASFPGSNGRIVFEGSPGLVSVAENGSGASPLTALSASRPAVSADGNLIAFSRAAGASAYGIWTVNADGTGARQVTVDPQAVAGNDTDPAWSPDGSRIAFVRSGDLYVMNADGSASTNLTSTFGSSVSDPDWSPAGDEIAFAASNQIYVIGSGGTPGPTPLNPTAPGNRSNPSWSPDASAIAYTRGPVGANGGIWQINRATAPNEAPLFTGAAVGEVWELAWSPDGTRIGFISDVGNPFQEELFTVGIDGTGLVRLNQDTSTGMDWGVPSSAAPAVPAPVVGRAVNVREVRGQVLVAVPAGSARAAQSVPGLKGLRFVPITQARQIPVGSVLDTRKGTVRLTSARDSRGTTQNGDFAAGVFQVLQSRAARSKGLTELRLKGSSFKGCTRRAKRSQPPARVPKPRPAGGCRGAPSAACARTPEGRFRTRGRYSSATVRGTTWTTTDRCDGTLTKVTRGRVTVRDFRRRKNITLRRGKSYLARARR